MKKILLIGLLLSFGFAQKEYDKDHIVERDTIYIKKFSNEIVSGKVFGMWGDMKVPLGVIKDGKKEGKWISWYKNGNKEGEGTFKDGKEDGLWTYWWKNGKKESEGTFKDGKKDGKWTDWYENGQKKEEETYKDGVKNGLFTDWYENGKKYITRMEKRWKMD
jgi:antitoxin component YwqK of YwqJK toxin-antitoxin module|tara:strand:+ start:90 stop:575 length:486 start_codon:yes stop_codon:yes gene_type:complete